MRGQFGHAPLGSGDGAHGEFGTAFAARISLSICMEMMQALWLVIGSAQGLMNEAAQRELVRRMRMQIAACALPLRRAQSAPARQQVATHDHAFIPRITCHL